MTAPYDLKYVDDVKKDIVAYKIGSGDITWKKIIKKDLSKRKTCNNCYWSIILKRRC